MKKFLGIDIGGTSVKIGLLTEDGTFLADRQYATAFDGYKTPILTTVLNSADAFLKEQGLTPSDLSAIGVSGPGQIDPKRGIVEGAASALKGWPGTPLKSAIHDRFGLPTYTLNDANAAALGEQWIGGAKGKANAIVFTIGTGVGGGIILDNRLVVGAHGIGGEMGHMIVQCEGERCTCGNVGCLEHYSSTTALIRNVKEAVARGEIAPFDGDIDGASIFARAAAGDTAVVAIIHKWLSYLASAIISVMHMLNPEIVLIGGGVSAQEEFFMEPLRQKVLAEVMPEYVEDFTIAACTLGNRAGMAGTVCYAKQRLELGFDY